MTVSSEIHARLRQDFSPSVLEVVDESESHRGHSGFKEGGESHFRIRIASSAFEGQSRIARHRAIHAALGKELIGRIHALAIEIVD